MRIETALHELSRQRGEPELQRRLRHTSSSRPQSQGRHSDCIGDDLHSEHKIVVEQLIVDGNNDASEFVCQICQTHLIGCRPKQTSCSHLFCGDCISKWQVAHKQMQTWVSRARVAEVAPTCPVCKTPIRAESDLHAVCPEGKGDRAMLWKRLVATPIVCARSAACDPAGRCKWVGTYGTYQLHIRSCIIAPAEGPAAQVRLERSIAPAAATTHPRDAPEPVAAEVSVKATVEQDEAKVQVQEGGGDIRTSSRWDAAGSCAYSSRRRPARSPPRRALAIAKASPATPRVQAGSHGQDAGDTPTVASGSSAGSGLGRGDDASGWHVRRDEPEAFEAFAVHWQAASMAAQAQAAREAMQAQARWHAQVRAYWHAHFLWRPPQAQWPQPASTFGESFAHVG